MSINDIQSGDYANEALFFRKFVQERHLYALCLHVVEIISEACTLKKFESNFRAMMPWVFRLEQKLKYVRHYGGIKKV